MINPNDIKIRRFNGSEFSDTPEGMITYSARVVIDGKETATFCHVSKKLVESDTEYNIHALLRRFAAQEFASLQNKDKEHDNARTNDA